VEEALVGIDVAHAVEEGLVEQGGLDGSLAIPEESDEVFERDGEGFGAGAGIFFFLGSGRDDGETAEAASIDEAKLLSAAKGQDGVGVGGDWSIRCGNEKAAGHAEMDEELGGLFCVIFRPGQVSDDGLTDAVNAVDAAVGEHIDDFVGWGLEGLRFVAGPDRADGLAMNAGMDTVRYSFDFGEFGHSLLQV